MRLVQRARRLAAAPFALVAFAAFAIGAASLVAYVTITGRGEF